MAQDTITTSNGLKKHLWDKDLVFGALENPIRRAILFSLARNGSQSAAAFVSGGRSVNAVIKQVAWLRKAGMVVDNGDSADARKQLYKLSAQIPVSKTETGALIDFGFLLIPL